MKMRNTTNKHAIKCNCASKPRQPQQQQRPQQQQQQQQQEIINSNNARRKCRKKASGCCSSSANGKTYGKVINASISRLLIASRTPLSTSTSLSMPMLLLLLITMTATTTTIRQTSALAVTASQLSTSPLTALLLKSASTSSASSSPSSAAALLAAASLLSPTQQRQQQQQQLFALLTKNRQTSGNNLLLQQQQPHHRQRQQQQQQQQREEEQEQADRYDDDVDRHRVVENIENINTSMETSGFVADDGQQYEKAEQVLAAAAAAAGLPPSAAAGGGGIGTNAVNCPKECKCLNDFFDCGKKHLDRVPELPSYAQVIDLVGNKLNDSTVLQIANLPELVKLSLKRNQLETVPQFVGLSSLKHLNLANNRIQRISSEALAALPKLKALDMSRNILHTVEASYFPQSNRLAHLILSYNEIASVSENSFETLGDLVELDLNNNHLSTLPTGVFRSLGKLKKLSLNYNNLEINWSTFKGLVSLQKLFLKSNNIRALQDGVFHVMRSIETIELDHNSITSLSRQGLFNLTKLHHLSLSNNSISRIELDTWEFTQSLISLDLSHNNISEFKPQHLDCLMRLKHLNLGHNKINYLVENTFDCVKNLEDLNLRRNKLAWIIEDQGSAPPFKALKKLKKLDLYGNNLKQINSKSLNGLTSLETLNLGGNALATIQSGAFDHMAHLQKVVFKSLNFICDCDLLWFRRWLQRTHTAQVSGNALCGYPEHLLDRELLSLAPAELICADTPKPVITQEPTNQLAVKGANITMECIAISPAAASLAAADELKIKWRHDNQNVRERATLPGGHQSVMVSSAETQIHHNQETNQTTIIGYLRLYNVSYESAGKYQCVVSNAFGTTYSQKFKLSIGIHPSFLQIPSNLTIDAGDTARLVCSATGDPMPEIALQKFGASDFPAATERRLQVVREENAFIITNAKAIDAGIYTCTAESAAGEIKINASLVVNDKPQPSIPLVRKEIVLAQASVLECLTDLTSDTGSPPHREWFKDNKPFHTSATSASERYYFTTEKELLIIVNTQSIDTGLYRCEITDDSKTYTMQTELIVVKEEFNQNVIIIGVALVTVACILIGSIIIWAVLYFQKRKLYLGSIRANGNGSTGGGHHASQHALSGSRGGALDQTQLTTLNRSYLHQSQSHPAGQRPRSIGDLDLNRADVEQRSCLIVSPGQNYQDGITLEYLTRHSRADLELLEHNQDHLSSKDSGTGSDAAVKRSIDDFTLSLLPPDEYSQPLIVSTPAEKRTQATADGPVDATQGGAETDDDVEFVESPAMGVSEYEMSPLNGKPQDCDRLRHNNNQSPPIGKSGPGTGRSPSGSEGSCVGEERAIAKDNKQHKDLPMRACKTNLSTNFNTNTKHAQAVDI